MNAVVLRNITKRFGDTVANDCISIAIGKGEVHGLLGENGAGKTTLMNILYGLYSADSGSIFINEEETQIRNPKEAILCGIGMIHQHFMLVPVLTIAENIVLGVEPPGILFDRKKACTQVEELSRRYGLSVDPSCTVANASVGIEQRVEILKALYRKADILILDEPTAVLVPQEVEELFKVIRALKQSGKTIIFISHKLREPMAICDRISVLRKGRFVGTVVTEKTDTHELARMMVGREVELNLKKSPMRRRAPVLIAESVSALNDRLLPALKEVSFTLHSGEILGIAGVEGNGQSELVDVITGLRKVAGGKILFNSEDITHSDPKTLHTKGLCHIPEDRYKRGIIGDFTVAENLILGQEDAFRKGIFLDEGRIVAHAQGLIDAFNIITPSPKTICKTLSGGNLQKVVVAREFSRNPRLFIAAQPTRGLDVGAIEYIHGKLLEERDAGGAILLVSADLDEIMALSDRIAIMYEGAIVAELEAQNATEETLGLLMAGVVK